MTALAAPDAIATPRLVLRRTSADDADAVYAYARDPDVSRYVTWRPHTRPEEAREFLAWCHDRWTHGVAFNWAITTLADGRLIGTIEARPDEHRVELGYVLGRDAWGQGFAPEAVQAVTHWALRQAPIHRVWAVCDLENKRSARVLEKAGFAREGCLRAWALLPAFGAVRDVWCYAIVKTREDA